jgi:SAM-dependent methyltransferase
VALNTNPNAECEPEYYNKLFGRKLKYKCPPWQSSHIPIWQAALELVRDAPCIYDLGCGTGQFAQLANHEGITGWGVDFSPTAINIAWERNLNWQFKVMDLREWIPPVHPPHGMVYTCLETLEHLQDDLTLVSKIPTDSTLVFSLPTGRDPAHFRWFDEPWDVRERYMDLLELDYCERVNQWILTRGKRR